MTIFRSPYGDIPIPEVSITTLVLDGLSLAADRVVLSCEATGQSLTGATLADRIRRFAGGLAERGFGPGDTLAIMSANTPDFVTVFHGAALAGGTITTVNPTYTAHELRHQLKDSGATVLVVMAPLLPVAREAMEGTGITTILTLGKAEGVPAIEDHFGSPMATQVQVDLTRSVVALPYSSGTTGLPKGVMLSHRNLVANVLQCQHMMKITPDEVTLAVLPFFHIYGMQVLMNLYLSSGARLVTLPRFDLETALRVLEREGVQRFFVAPPVVLALAKHPLVDNFDLSKLSFMLSGAAPLGADLAEAAARRLDAEVTQGYGMTEASPVTHFTAQGRNRAGSVGHLAPGTEARLLSPETGQPVEEGELWVRGPQVMLGYHNNPEATARTLTDGWLHTGDLAREVGDGYFEIRDRVKELIKVSGFQVAPAEVEAALVSHPQISDAAVTAMPDAQSGERPCAHVVLRAGSDLTAEDVLAHLAERLAPYKRPTRVLFVETIPKSASGKILRRLLKT